MDDFFRFSKKLGFWVFLVHPTVVSVLLSALVERCFVSRIRDFSCYDSSGGNALQTYTMGINIGNVFSEIPRTVIYSNVVRKANYSGLLLAPAEGFGQGLLFAP